MRNKITILFTAILMISMISTCGGNKIDSNNPLTTPTTGPTTTATDNQLTSSSSMFSNNSGTVSLDGIATVTIARQVLSTNTTIIDNGQNEIKANRHGQAKITVIDNTSGKSATATAVVNSTIDHIAITPADPLVLIGKTLQLTATAYDASHNEISIPSSDLTWASDNKGVATIDSSSGIITGIHGGFMTVRVLHISSTKSAIATVVVNSPIDHISITPENPSILIGETLPLTATAYDASHNEISISESDLTWTSDNAGVVTIDSSSGIITGIHGDSTTVRVTHVSSAKNATATVVVNSAIDHISITPADTSIIIGETLPLSATAYDASNNEISINASDLTWASDNTGVATIDSSSGIITGIYGDSTTVRVTHVSSAMSAIATVVVNSMNISGTGNADFSNGLGTWNLQQKGSSIAAYTTTDDSANIYICGTFDGTTLSLSMYAGNQTIQ